MSKVYISGPITGVKGMDEPHYTACLWNLVALWWTHDNINSEDKDE